MQAARIAPSSEELARAVRLLRLRGRREATGLFTGSSVSPFRGAGLEFEESRPYVPGDDISILDWNATARTGELFVKRHREERSHTVLFALDTSGSMAFGSAGTSKAALAAHAVALLTAAAGRAGDRTALVAFAASVRERIAPGRGGAHALRLLRAAVHCAASPGERARLPAALATLNGLARRRATAVLLSDFRDTGEDVATLRRCVSELARHHDVIALPIRDPAEIALPRLGVLRVADPARAGRTRLLDTSRRRVRQRYREAATEHKRALDDALTRAGAEVQWLRTDASPLEALARLFAARASRRGAR